MSFINYFGFSKVIEFLHPDELAAEMDLELSDVGTDDETLLMLCHQTLRYSVKTGMSVNEN